MAGILRRIGVREATILDETETHYFLMATIPLDCNTREVAGKNIYRIIDKNGKIISERVEGFTAVLSEWRGLAQPLSQ